MKTIGYLLFAVFLSSCKSKDSAAQERLFLAQKQKAQKEALQTVFKPYQLNADYTVIDTGQYADDGPMGGGAYAVVKKNGGVADTINLHFGMKPIGQHAYVYQTLIPGDNAVPIEAKGNLSLTAGSYLVIIGNHKKFLRELVPHFDEYYSSPNVIFNKVYYWQLEKIDSLGTLKVSAAYYDPFTHITSSHFLLNDKLETDDSNYFSFPYIQNNKIIFYISEKQQWKLATDFK